MKLYGSSGRNWWIDVLFLKSIEIGNFAIDFEVQQVHALTPWLELVL